MSLRFVSFYAIYGGQMYDLMNIALSQRRVALHIQKLVVRHRIHETIEAVHDDDRRATRRRLAHHVHEKGRKMVLQMVRHSVNNFHAERVLSHAATFVTQWCTLTLSEDHAKLWFFLNYYALRHGHAVILITG
eukprot:TRINITY_DN2972_c0_g1_i1.p1 TRINITY_DN2972_c0_g1~~TRINITY_DN2972_c0_g1_i1.p1  ORF type:complete len:133 (+),score=5.25 TRINITY_DN2972_c0_g1_i1:632-1030(+)